ncbi:uncharacterized protein HaLaN_14210, partial [Haematococcus lacustris]
LGTPDPRAGCIVVPLSGQVREGAAKTVGTARRMARFMPYRDAGLACEPGSSCSALKKAQHHPGENNRTAHHLVGIAAPASVASVATHTYNKLLGDGRVALSQPDMYFSPVPQKTVSILNRPPNGYLGSPSRKNVENYEAQYQRDQAAFEKHAACLRRQADQPWHHDGPSPPSLWERGHIADRGRGRTDVAAAQGLFNPITSEFKIEPKLLEGWKGHGQRPTSAPPGKAPAALSSREDKALQAARGVRDPIT